MYLANKLLLEPVPCWASAGPGTRDTGMLHSLASGRDHTSTQESWTVCWEEGTWWEVASRRAAQEMRHLREQRVMLGGREGQEKGRLEGARQRLETGADC